MCKIQSLLYLLCIGIFILITTLSASLLDGTIPKTFEEFQKSIQNETRDTVESIHAKIFHHYRIKALSRTALKRSIAKMRVEKIDEQSGIISDILLNHRIYKASKKVAVFISKYYQVQTTDIVKDVFESGKKCYIPLLDKNNQMVLARLRSFVSFDKLPRFVANVTLDHNIDLNDDPMETGDLDLIIVPGLGFSHEGQRLGRGFGSYDRYLKKYDQKFPYNKCLSIGLALNVQMCRQLPVDSDDYTLDYVIYPLMKEPFVIN